ncbi:hypothetical protein BHE74_00008426 [Ensete ventricosum]|nr:hypothetical protein GW17_00001315 [Ensete ventricosum]RWW83080.1 hypothetical protein BHE74_00008426 [Ensete ventricosum]RZR87398.1 hypothetical protein BHM03_00014804 [Ensete ventricosum]
MKGSPELTRDLYPSRITVKSQGFCFPTWCQVIEEDRSQDTDEMRYHRKLDENRRRRGEENWPYPTDGSKGCPGVEVTHKRPEE